MIQIKFISMFGDELLQTVNPLIFSGGEVHVNLPEQVFSDGDCVYDITLEARLTCSSDVMELLMVTDSLKRSYPDVDIFLVMPYIPYARQDRVCQSGDAFSLKVFANLINSQSYKKITVADSHSYVATALINNVFEIPQQSFAYDFVQNSADSEFLNSLGFLLAPDAGASKKTEQFAAELNLNHEINVEVIQSLKVRDKVGKITSTNVLHDDFNGKNCLIVDDIIDGGASFFPLAKILKARNANKVGLYVTHGIFSRGVDIVFDNDIDFIFTTDSFEQKDSRVNVIHKFFSN